MLGMKIKSNKQEEKTMIWNGNLFNELLRSLVGQNSECFHNKSSIGEPHHTEYVKIKLYWDLEVKIFIVNNITDWTTMEFLW